MILKKLRLKIKQNKNHCHNATATGALHLTISTRCTPSASADSICSQRSSRATWRELGHYRV